MQCPRDGHKLETRTIEGVEVDGCGRCGGLFLDAGELEAIEEAHLAHAGSVPEAPDVVSTAMEMAQQQRRAGAICPKCKLQMSPREYAYASQIVLDGCGRCGGVWLDVGELERIEDFFVRERTAEDEGGSVLMGLLRRLGLR